MSDLNSKSNLAKGFKEETEELDPMSKAELIALLNRWPAGRLLSLLKKVGGEEAADDILADRKIVVLEKNCVN